MPIKMSEVRAKFPQYNDLSDDDLLIGLRQRFYSDIAPADFYSQVERDTERDGMLKENAASLSLPDRWAANWSAGYGNLTQGLQQLLSKTGAVSAPTDADITEKRERDRYLARNAGDKIMQIGGEALPLMALPVPGAQAAGLGPVSSLMLQGAVGGGAGAALSPVASDESRGANMAAGILIGAAIPGGAVATRGAARGIARRLTEEGAKSRAILAIAEALPGDRAAALAERLRATPKATLRGEPVDIPKTAAQATNDPYLAQLEAASRSRPTTQPGWAEYDAAQNAARYGLLKELTPSELRLERLAKVREGRTAPLREAALAQASTAPDFASPVTQRALDLISGPSGANPAVKNVAQYVLREAGEDAGAAVTPARAYEIRKVLASKLSGPSAIGDELAASAKGASRETSGLISAIDDAIDSASGGGWKPYLAEYSTRSKPISSGRALRDTFEKIDAKPLRGDTPEVTYAGLNSATRATEGKYGDKLTGEARGDLDTFLDTLRQAEAAGRTRKTSATMGGGSITNTDQMLGRLTSRVIEGLPGIGGYASRVRDLDRDLVEQHIARLMQQPGELGAALRNLDPGLRQQLVDEALRGAGVSAAVGAAE